MKTICSNIKAIRDFRNYSQDYMAYKLGISPRTVEIHRAHIMGKMEASSLSDLVRVVLAAEQGNGGHA